MKLGKVGRAHGVRGSFFISDRVDPVPKEFTRLGIGPTSSQSEVFAIKERGVSGQRPFVTVDRIVSRDQVQPLVGQTVWFLRSELQVDHSREYLLSELKGRSVFDANDKHVGTIDSVYITTYEGINVSIASLDEKLELDLPFSETYFDMSFGPYPERLILTASKDLFEDIWNAKKSQ